MGTRILSTDGYNNEDGAVLFCSANGWAFGPIFESGEMAEAFIQYVSESGRDVKELSNGDLGYAHTKFLDEWKYCGLTADERREYDDIQVASVKVANPRRWLGQHKRLAVLMGKVEDNREERWNL